MGRDQQTQMSDDIRREDQICWRELLLGALSGLYPTEEKLEQMLDHLERTP